MKFSLRWEWAGRVVLTNGKRPLNICHVLQDLDQNVDNLQQDKKLLNKQLEERGAEITKLNDKISEQDQELGEKFREIVQREVQLDELWNELWDVWTSYENDRQWWKQRADKVLGLVLKWL